MATEQEITAIKRKHSAWLLRQPGVCGAGVEKDESGNYVLAVHLDASDPNAGTTVPDSLDGAPVKRIRSGPFRKQ